jgi:hypothetical protein
MVRYVVRFHNLQTPLRIFQGVTHQGGQNTYSSMKLNTEIEYQPMLFSLMETGILTQTVQKKIRQTYLKAWVFGTLTVQEDCLIHSHSGTYSGFFILLNTDLAPFFTSLPAYSVPFFTSLPAYSVPFFILDIFSLTIFTHLIIRILLSVCSNLLNLTQPPLFC